jgi:hypothetical protein
LQPIPAQSHRGVNSVSVNRHPQRRALRELLLLVMVIAAAGCCCRWCCCLLLVVACCLCCPGACCWQRTVSASKPCRRRFVALHQILSAATCGAASSGKIPATIRFAIQPNRPLLTSLWQFLNRQALIFLVFEAVLPLPTYPAHPQMFRSRAVDPALRQLVVAGACH